MSDCSQELVSIHNSLANILTKKFTSMTLWCDNRSAESNVKTGDSIKLRHMTDIKEHYVSKCVERLLICVMWIASKEQETDVITESLSFELHKKLVKLISNL